MVKYSATSPWNRTRIQGEEFLDILRIRPVPADPDDILYEIESQFTYRPDLLAFYLYGSQKLWWVFAQRNMNVLKDPVYDFEPGIQIYLPKKSRLQELLGV